MLIEADLWLTNTGTMCKETNEQPQVLVDQQSGENRRHLSYLLWTECLYSSKMHMLKP